MKFKGVSEVEVAEDTCYICRRSAVAFVIKKWPAVEKVNKWVCGYHLRPYRTSEYRKIWVKKHEPKKTIGYAPEELL